MPVRPDSPSFTLDHPPSLVSGAVPLQPFRSKPPSSLALDWASGSGPSTVKGLWPIVGPESRGRSRHPDTQRSLRPRPTQTQRVVTGPTDSPLSRPPRSPGREHLPLGSLRWTRPTRASYSRSRMTPFNLPKNHVKRTRKRVMGETLPFRKTRFPTRKDLENTQGHPVSRRSTLPRPSLVVVDPRVPDVPESSFTSSYHSSQDL